MKTGVLVKYKDFLPVTPKTPLFSLGEGDTPLVRCGELEEAFTPEGTLNLDEISPVLFLGRDVYLTTSKDTVQRIP